MIAATNDSVLIEQVVALASKAREATGQDPIYDLPKGVRTSKLNCPIARALNLHCEVGGSSITFPTAEQARLIGQALGLHKSSPRTLMIPEGHPFKVFVARFDGARNLKLRAFMA